jgi:hypothetical protein
MPAERNRAEKKRPGKPGLLELAIACSFDESTDQSAIASRPICQNRRIQDFPA